MNELLIKVEECTGGKGGPLARSVEVLVNSGYEVPRLEVVIPARSGVVVGELFSA